MSEGPRRWNVRPNDTGSDPMPSNRNRWMNKAETCVVCAQAFRHRQNRTQVVCSPRCSQAGRTALLSLVRTLFPPSLEIMCPLNWRPCDDCGLDILRPGMVGGQRLCVPCAKQRNRQCALAEYYRVRKPRDGFGARELTCSACGTSFVGHGRKARAYCSSACSIAKRRNITVTESFKPMEIYQRDHLRCAICMRPLAMERVVPHPDAPTIDHILPVVEGGVHSRANVRAAHFRCNSVRSNRGQAQLRMIG